MPQKILMVVNGRKLHILLDVMSFILVVFVQAASIQDRDGAKLVLDKLKYLFPKLHFIWAHGGKPGSLNCFRFIQSTRSKSQKIRFLRSTKKW